MFSLLSAIPPGRGGKPRQGEPDHIVLKRWFNVLNSSEMVAQADRQAVRPQAGFYVVDGNSLGNNVHKHIAR